MDNKEVVKSIAGDKALRITFQICRNLVDNAITGLQDLRVLADTIARDNTEAPDEVLDWWNLVEIRTGNILESLGQIQEQMNPEPVLVVPPLFVKDEPFLCREDFVMANDVTAFVKGSRYSIKEVIDLEEGDYTYLLVNRRGDDHVLDEEDIARYFVPMEVVDFEQNEKDKEF